MGLLGLLVIAVGVSMDAFAVAICKGLSVKRVDLKHAAIVGVYFGGFQALMPLIGYILGSRFQSLIASFDHWIAFGLLMFIGINMIRESSCDYEALNDSFAFKTMLPLAVATSIDALAVGVTLAFLQVSIISAVIFIGVITFSISFLGVKVGNMFGSKCKSKAELLGGSILALMGINILLEHLGVFG